MAAKALMGATAAQMAVEAAQMAAEAAQASQRSCPHVQPGKWLWLQPHQPPQCQLPRPNEPPRMHRRAGGCVQSRGVATESTPATRQRSPMPHSCHQTSHERCSSPRQAVRAGQAPPQAACRPRPQSRPRPARRCWLPSCRRGGSDQASGQACVYWVCLPCAYAPPAVPKRVETYSKACGLRSTERWSTAAHAGELRGIWWEREACVREQGAG